MKKKNKQVGGVGTDGNVATLTADIASVIENVVKAMVNTTELVYDIFKLPSELSESIPYKYPSTPGVNL